MDPINPAETRFGCAVMLAVYLLGMAVGGALGWWLGGGCG